MNLRDVHKVAYFNYCALLYSMFKQRYSKIPGHVLRRLIREHTHCVKCEHVYDEYNEYKYTNICCCELDDKIEWLERQLETMKNV